ncbi:nitrogenase iron-molybdenum cofactor biosynthesis protein NifN [Nostoc punctiforme UO1]|uniref:nitrogenase iron-molybdenum cofactor biosynthesis protein NifN n=1 Tax=Nostoc punctiforme TaxID=272131 RepID=UPI0030B05812
MTQIINNQKAAAVSPLKLSSPLGAAIAFIGMKRAVPLFHGSQGCTAFAKRLLFRHFNEAVPLSTTAMTELSSILGGEENLQQAILNIASKQKPEIIGLCTTGLTETRGEDVAGILKAFREKFPELDNLPIVVVPTPDFKGSLQDGYAAAVEQTVLQIPEEQPLVPNQVTILAGSLLTPGDLHEIKDMVKAMGFNPIVLPDLSGSVDGHWEENQSALSSGGTSLSQIRSIGGSALTLAIGYSMEKSAKILYSRFGTPFEVIPRLTGLSACDRFFEVLCRLKVELSPELNSNIDEIVPEIYRRQRSQLQDAILDAHFYFGGKRVALALEPDLLHQTAWWLTEMGAEIHTAITTTEGIEAKIKNESLERSPVREVIVGDLEDLELLSADADLLITNSHGARVAHRLGKPLVRLGYPFFDRLGAAQQCTVGYRGSTQLLFDVGNIFLEKTEKAVANKWKELEIAP